MSVVRLWVVLGKVADSLWAGAGHIGLGFGPAPGQGPKGPAWGAGPNPNLNPMGLRLNQHGPQEY